MIPARDDLRRLHFINALFAHVTGHDLPQVPDDVVPRDLACL